MEENKNNKQKRGVVDFSVVLSFVVAIFAVISLAVFGIVSNQGTSISYAADEEESLPDEFIFEVLERNGNPVQIKYSKGGSWEGYTVPMYVIRNTTKPVFCVQAHVDPGIGENYTKEKEIDDYGLLYLLNNTYANGVKITDATGEYADYVEGWVTQTAIWMYLYETNEGAAEHAIENPEDIKQATKLGLNLSGETIYDPGYNIYDKYVAPLVEKAKKATSDVMLNAKLENETITPSEDKKYYFTSLITVTGDPSSALKSYDVTVSGIEGAVVVDENGSELGTTIQPGTKFYVRVPADKVTDEAQKVSISIKGTFNTLTGNYYKGAANHQRAVSVKAAEKTDSKNMEVIFKAPDTGMNKVQTIYFIGLIVLLCGVGIVYANAKPVQIKQ